MNKNRNTEQSFVPNIFTEALEEFQLETKPTRLNTRHSREEKKKYEKRKNPRRFEE